MRFALLTSSEGYREKCGDHLLGTREFNTPIEKYASAYVSGFRIPIFGSETSGVKIADFAGFTLFSDVFAPFFAALFRKSRLACAKSANLTFSDSRAC